MHPNIQKTLQQLHRSGCVVQVQCYGRGAELGTRITQEMINLSGPGLGYYYMKTQYIEDNSHIGHTKKE